MVGNGCRCSIKPVVAQQLASESGYRSYSTFSLAFKQRTGQSVTAWMRQSGVLLRLNFR
jgi:AraC-like DNA-binding protein